MTLSFVLFILYAIYQVFDLNTYMQQTMIDPHISRFKIVYTYLSGYMQFILKILISLCILFASLIVIFVLLTAIIYMFSAERNLVSSTGSPEGVTTTLKASVFSIVSTITKATLGIFLIPETILVLFIVIPTTIFVVYFIYSNMTYGNEHETYIESEKIAKTNYYFALWFMVTIFVCAMVFVYVNYIINASSKSVL